MRLYVDMDGVLTQCHYAALMYHDVILTEWPQGKYVQQILIEHGHTEFEKLSRREFWATYSEGFWRHLKKTAICDNLLGTCGWIVGRENVFIATLPAAHQGCWGGKYAWVLDNLPEWIHDQVIMIQGGKEALAKPDTILIDDNESNVDAFADAGGVGILMPQPWNGNAHDSQAVINTLPEILNIAKNRVRAQCGL